MLPHNQQRDLYSQQKGRSIGKDKMEGLTLLGIMLLSSSLASYLTHEPTGRYLALSTYRPTILYRDIPWMSRVSRPANQTAFDQLLTAAWEKSLLVSVGMIYIDKLQISRWCVPSSLMAATIWLLAAVRELRTPHCPKCEIPNLSLYNTSSSGSR